MWLRKFFCILLVLALLFSLAACGASAPETPAPKPGRWVEEEVDLPMPDGASSFCLFSHEGVLDAVFYDRQTNFNAVTGAGLFGEPGGVVMGWSRSTDLGKTWQAQDISFLEEPLKNYRQPVCDLRVGGNGEVWFCLHENVSYFPTIRDEDLTLFFVKQSMTLEEKKAYIDPRYYYLDHGKAVEVALPFPSFGSSADFDFRVLTSLADFFPLEDGSCLFSLLESEDFGRGTFAHVNPEGRLLDSFEISDAGKIFQISGNWVLARSGFASVCRIDLTDQSAETLPFFDGFESGLGYGIDEDGTAYVVSQSGVSQVAAGGALQEELIPNDGYFFTSKNNTFRQLVPCGEALFTIANGNILLRYHYDPDFLLPEETSLTVFSMHEDPVVWQTIAQLGLTNPGLRVTYRIGDNEIDGTITEQDYIKMLNTELLAGTGPDVVILDGLGSPSSYLESGVFLDLKDLIDTGGLFQNLLQAGEYGEGLYAVPAGICFPALHSAFSDIPRRQDSLPPEEAAVRLTEPFPRYETLQSVLDDSEKQAGKNVFQKTAEGKKQICLLSPSFKKASFESFYLAAVPELADPDAGAAGIEIFLNAVSWMAPDSASKSNSYCLLDADVICSYSQILRQKSFAALPSLSGQKVFFPHTLAAVPNKKAPPDNALTFLNAMLSEDVQAQNFYGRSFVANDDVDLFQLLSAGGCVPMRESCLTQARFDRYNGGEEARSNFCKAVLSLDTPVYIDIPRAEKFYEISYQYLQGKITMEEAVEAILTSYSREDTLSALEREK